MAEIIEVNLSLESSRNERDRGAWAPRTPYSVGDKVSEAGTDYICISEHHYSDATFIADQAEHWISRDALYAPPAGGVPPPGAIPKLSDIGNVPVPVPANNGQLLAWNDATQSYDFITSSGVPRQRETITVGVDGQTVFALTQAPTNVNEVQVVYRKLIRDVAVDFSIVGAVLTFTMPDIDTFAGDLIQVWYE